MASPRLGPATLLAYAAPGLVLALFISPFPSLVAAFFAKYTAATTGGIATVLLFTRILDGVVDPPLGYLSDRTRSRFGPRKPWIFAGLFLTMGAIWAMFIPPEGAGDGHFALAMVLHALGLSLIDIPLKAWAGELATDYQERARIAGYVTFAILSGGMIFMLLPEVLAALGVVEHSAFDLPMMAIMGKVALVLAPLALLVTLVMVPQGKGAAQAATHGIAEIFNTVRHNRPFWTFMSADGLTQIGFGAFYAVFFVALDSYFGLGANVPVILLTVTLSQLACIPLVSMAARRFGKHRVWGVAWIAHSAVLPLILLFGPGDTPLLPFCALSALLAVLQTPQMMLPMAMVSDIADFDTMRSGRNRQGSYYAFRLMCLKGMSAIGAALGFYALSVSGFDPKSSIHDATATAGMLTAMLAIPGITFLGAGLILLRFPIDARRHAIIRAWIDRRQARALP